jgi:hypothetical protein
MISWQPPDQAHASKNSVVRQPHDITVVQGSQLKEPALRRAAQNSHRRHDDAAGHDPERRLQEWRVRVLLLDP